MAEQRLVDRQRFAELARAGSSLDGLTLACVGHSSIGKAIDPNATTLKFYYSKESVDLMGDVVKAAGWEIDPNRNSALWGHDASIPPIGQMRNVHKAPPYLMGDIEFAPADLSRLADAVRRMYIGGFLRGVSVGFVPLQWSWSKDPARPTGIDFQRQLLMEISCTPTPACGDAVLQARSAGIDTLPFATWAERALDGGVQTLLARSDLEELRTAARGSTKSVTVVARQAEARQWLAEQRRKARLAEVARLRSEVGL
jgi:hypothetical protein